MTVHVDNAEMHLLAVLFNLSPEVAFSVAKFCSESRNTTVSDAVLRTVEQNSATNVSGDEINWLLLGRSQGELQSAVIKGFPFYRRSREGFLANRPSATIELANWLEEHLSLAVDQEHFIKRGCMLLCSHLIIRNSNNLFKERPQ